MKIYTTRKFDRDLGDQIDDLALRKTIDEIERGFSVISLGGGLCKVRIAARRRGKRGSYRAYLAYRPRFRAVFMYGFSKGGKGDIGDNAKDGLKKLAGTYLGRNSKEIRAATRDGALREI